MNTLRPAGLGRRPRFVALRSAAGGTPVPNIGSNRLTATIGVS